MTSRMWGRALADPGRRFQHHSERVLVSVLAPVMDTALLSAATSVAIRAEQLAQHALRGGARSRPGAGGPLVHWHEGGSGSPVLLLNGWAASGLVWPTRVVKRLERHFHVLRVDARGTGGSRGAPMPFTIADLADDAVSVLRASGHEQAVVAGLSMGGMVAQEIAIRHPETVTRLILLATRPPVPAHIGSPKSFFALATAAPPADQRLDDYLRALWAGFTAPGFADAHPEVIDEIVAAVLARTTTRAGLFNQARAAVAWHGPRRLRGVGVPTVVVHGDRDGLIPVDNGVRLAGLIPTARYVELPGVGHLIPFEAADIFAQIIGDAR
jgi:3-oxoadipate enol-lactonase